MSTAQKPRLVDPDDRAIAALIDDQAREIRELQQELKEAREMLAEFTPVDVHLHEFQRCADLARKYTVRVSYRRVVRFDNWPGARDLVKATKQSIASRIISAIHETEGSTS